MQTSRHLGHSCQGCPAAGGCCSGRAGPTQLHLHQRCRHAGHSEVKLLPINAPGEEQAELEGRSKKFSQRIDQGHTKRGSYRDDESISGEEVCAFWSSDILLPSQTRQVLLTLLSAALQPDHHTAVLHQHLPTPCAQAICRTHLLRFVGTAYELLDWVKLPCNSSFNDIFGPGSFEAEPVAQGEALGARFVVPVIIFERAGVVAAVVMVPLSLSSLPCNNLPLNNAIVP
eukprot:1140325-Pelagomonas_calceolata.AAC.8